MAKPVKLGKGKEFTFAAPAKDGGETKYPWDSWFNGDLLLLEQSLGTKDDKGTVVEVSHGGKRDYEVDTSAMPAKMKTAARRRYKVVQISRIDADGKRLKDSLIIRARDMTAEERQAEDTLREEEKAENFMRRKAAKEKAATNGMADHTEPAAAEQATA